jgi:hypothetical protein
MHSLAFLVVVGILWVLLIEKVGFVVTSMGGFFSDIDSLSPGERGAASG